MNFITVDKIKKIIFCKDGVKVEVSVIDSNHTSNIIMIKSFLLRMKKGRIGILLNLSESLQFICILIKMMITKADDCIPVKL